MPKKNRHGLSRYIPADVKRAVREKCGFGCVVCGEALVDYDHFDSEYAEAERHDALGIILLCPKHHRKKGAFLSRDRIRKAIEAPYCLQEGFAWTELDFDSFEVRVGPITSERTDTVLKLREERVVWLRPPERRGAPMRLNLRLYDKNGMGLVTIEDNVWKVSSRAKDVIVLSGKEVGHIEVRDRTGIIFKSRLYAPNCFIVDTYKGWCGGKRFEVSTDPSGGGFYKIGNNPRQSGDLHVSGLGGAALQLT